MTKDCIKKDGRCFQVFLTDPSLDSLLLTPNVPADCAKDPSDILPVFLLHGHTLTVLNSDSLFCHGVCVSFN